MASLEMGAYPFVTDSQPLMEYQDIEEKVNTSFGAVKVSVYGDRTKHPIVTFHDIGLDSENNFQSFFQFGTVAEFASKFCVYNINAPGQEMDAKPLPDNYVYPTMDGLAAIVESVVSHFGFKSFIGFGIGAGANALLRYALLHQEKLEALILVNAVATKAGWLEWGYEKVNLNYLRTTGMTNFTVDYLMWHHFGKRLDECNPDIIRQYRAYFQNHPNPKNLAALIDSYLNRTALTLQSYDSALSQYKPILRMPVLQIVGARSPFIDDTAYINSQLDPAKRDWLKVSDACGLVLDDKPEAVSEALLLFLQGLGYFPTMNVASVIKKTSSALQSGGGCAIPAVATVTDEHSEAAM
ncbi:Protein Y48G10A.3 [Aphelenchoides avenae]|nr:Protein Y48G10A.3 [Aphelenchus avenae]